MARGLHAKNRIERVLSWSTGIPGKLKTSVVVLLTFCAAPIVFLTASTRPSLVAEVPMGAFPRPVPAAAAAPLSAIQASRPAPASPTRVASVTPIVTMGPQNADEPGVGKVLTKSAQRGRGHDGVADPVGQENGDVHAARNCSSSRDVE